MSVADAWKDTTAPFGPSAGLVMSSGTVRSGGVSVLTVTVPPPLPTLPLLSVASQVTGVSPSGKTDPDPGVQVSATGPSTASVAVAAYVTAAPSGPVASAGVGVVNVIEGGAVSGTP